MKNLNLKTMTIAAMLGTSLLLTGCGGGGGGSMAPMPDRTIAGNISGNLNEGSKDSITAEQYLDAAKVEFSGLIATDRTTASIYDDLNISGVEQAHDDGWTGKGSNVVIVDFFDTSGGHGDQVTLISGAVAPGANIGIVDINTNYREFLVGDIFVESQVDVLNGSFGLLETFTTEEWNDERDNRNDYHNEMLSDVENAVIVLAAGNNGDVTENLDRDCTIAGDRNTASSCSDAKFIENTSRTIFVGSVDGDDLTDYSVSAGDAMNDFIVADGTAFNGEQGTSFAAPRVTGAVALVSQKFPNTTAEDRKLIILNTADDLGITGVDAVFGHGRLNVGAALSPVGNLH